MPLNSQGLHPIFNEGRDTWIFDLDNTLYPYESDLATQMDQKIGQYVQRLLGLEYTAARKIQKGFLMQYGTTLKGLMVHHGVDPHEYLAEVHDIDLSSIKRDERLCTALQTLKGRKLVFTNADTPYAEKVLDRLGIAHQFEDVFDIHEADLVPKPNQEPYDTFIKRYDVDPTRSIMVEDMVRNLIPAHRMGMGCVWVNTGSKWGEADHDPAIVHAETNSLSQWLSHYNNRFQP